MATGTTDAWGGSLPVARNHAQARRDKSAPRDDAQTRPAPPRRRRAHRLLAGIDRIQASLTRWWHRLGEQLVGWAREPQRARAREEVVATLAPRLLAAPDPAVAMDETWLAVTHICRLTPGLRALIVTTSDTSWRVRRACGDLASTPMASSATFPPAPAEPVMAERRLHDTYPFDVAARQRCAWVAIFLPGTRPAAWLILGVPAGSRTATLTSMRTIAGLMALALAHPTAQERSATQHEPALPADPVTPAGSSAARPVHRDQGTDRAPDVAYLTDAIRRAGDEVMQRLSKLLQEQQPPAGTTRATRRHLSRLTAALVEDMSREATERITARDDTDALPEETGSLGGFFRTEVVTVDRPTYPRLGMGDDSTADNTSDEPTKSAAVNEVTGGVSPRGQAFKATPTTLQRHATTPAFDADELTAVETPQQSPVRNQPTPGALSDQRSGLQALPGCQPPRHDLLSRGQVIDATDDHAATRALGTPAPDQAMAVPGNGHQGASDQTAARHVEVSRSELEDSNFARRVRSYLDATSFSAASLVVEVTDTPNTLSPTARVQLALVAAQGVQINVTTATGPAHDEHHSRTTRSAHRQKPRTTPTTKSNGPSKPDPAALTANVG